MDEFILTVANYAKTEADDDITDIVKAAIEKCETAKMIAPAWLDHRGATTAESLKGLPAPTNVQGILNQIALDSKYEVIV